MIPRDASVFACICTWRSAKWTRRLNACSCFDQRWAALVFDADVSRYAILEWRAPGDRVWRGGAGKHVSTAMPDAQRPAVLL